MKFFKLELVIQSRLDCASWGVDSKPGVFCCPGYTTEARPCNLAKDAWAPVSAH